MKVTWGLTGNSHDASLAVWHDNNFYGDNGIRIAKITGTSDHSRSFFDHVKLDYGDPDEIVWYERPFLKTLRQWHAGQGWLQKENNIRQYLLDRGVGYTKITNKKVPIHYIQHHLSHAAYAYYTQPYKNCAVICLDSIGEFETLTVWHGLGGRLKKIHSQNYPHSLGLFYSAMTQRLGLIPQQDEHLVSDWAKKGDAKNIMSKMMNEIIHIDLDKPKIKMRQNLHRGCRWWHPELSSQQDLYDIAAATQSCFELAVKVLSNWTRWKTGANHLAIAGGGAMNHDAVNKLQSDWETIWVPPKPGDPGSAVGCILAHKQKFINNINKVWE